VGGRLFGQVKTADVAKAVSDAGLGELDKRKIELSTPIRSVGEYLATVRLHGDLVANIKLTVLGKK
jgi:large subunit ribosomal protein L9